MIELLNMDCMEYMKTCKDNEFDLAIVDPPYGIGAAKMTMGRGSGNDVGTHKKKGWDSTIPPKEYFIELQRVSRNQIIWGGNYFLDYLQNTRCMIMWDKKDYNSDFADGELAWTSFDKNTKIFQRARSAQGDSSGKIHPTQKPVKLYEWLLTNYAFKDHKILDTHLGSGSSAIAAHYFGCDFVGMEIDKDYYEAACERFKAETAQEALF